MAFQKSQWPEFEESAQRQLQLPEEGLQLLLWRYPYFEKFTSWQLADAELVRRVWHRPLDFLMVSDPLEGIRRGHQAQPNIERASVEFGPEQRQKLWRTLGQIQIPLVNPTTITLDGVQHGIHSRGCFHLTWNPLPKGWEPLQNWMDETLDWLDQFFESAN